MSVAINAAGQPRDAALAAAKGGVILGGGTLVVGDLNNGNLRSNTLISLDRLGLSKIDAGKTVTLGAMVTMAQIARDRRLAFLHPVARAIGGPAVRAMATVGGNLFAPSPYGDLAAALLALDAIVTLNDGKSMRKTAIADFLSHRAKFSKHVVLGVSFTKPDNGAFRFTKTIRRKPVSAAVVTIAALLPVKKGKLAGVRIAYGAMAPAAMRALAVEKALEGRALNAEAIAAAVKLAVEGTQPVDDAYASAWYRREILPVHLGRLLAGGR
jgi:CO/xanthine dehydrogenase FAD-binding subunit